MEPELMAGDRIVVWKPTLGARIFNVIAALRDEPTPIYRMPGIRDIRHNDVLIFNFPVPNDWSKIEMDLLKYYVKRCIALPGDSLSIEDGFYHVNTYDKPLGNMTSQRKLSGQEENSFEKVVYNTFPYDSIMKWNIKEFGPLYIPRSGDTLIMDRTNFCLYAKLIEWEQRGSIEYRESTVYLDNHPIESYCFQKNYYFVAGDHTENSQDSRYWGLLPEEYIVGKAWLIWKSIDPLTEKTRKDRFLKRIN